MDEFLNEFGAKVSCRAEDFLEGRVILLDKPYGWTSFDVVSKVRILLRDYRGIKKIKVGHAGTLDPLATGLLILCTGKATRRIEFFMGLPKEYIASVTFGGITPSYDMETEVSELFNTSTINSHSIEEALAGFKGKQVQAPPAFSAIKMKGKRAYELARAGMEVTMTLREVEFLELDLLEYQNPTARIRVSCSKGTYIRSFANDLGKAMDNGAYLTALERVAIGDVKLANALNIDAFQEMLKKHEL